MGSLAMDLGVNGHCDGEIGVLVKVEGCGLLCNAGDG